MPAPSFTLPAMDPLLATLALARAPGLHATTLRSALEQAPLAPEELPGLGAAQLRALGFGAAAAAWLERVDPARLESDRRWLLQSNTVVVSCLEPGYPPLLATLPDAPVALFIQGDAACLGSPQLAMVGSRSASAAGRGTAREFAAWFASRGLTITSGLALGIDAACHEGALGVAGARSIAVLGCGLDQVYPPENAALAARLAGRGALVSEFPPGVPPLKDHFPRRNRIISGLSLGTLVVEAAQRSGSLITARLAGEQGREVFAIPGSIRNPLAAGCHALIRQGAHLVESPEEVFAALQISQLKQYVVDNPAQDQQPSQPGPELDKAYKILLDALEFEPTSMDVLVARTGLPSPSVASMLLILELDGRVAAQPGGRYLRTT